MDIFDKESEIIELFMNENSINVCLIPQDDDTKNVYLSIHGAKNWKHWVNSSGKADPPPDFYSDKFGLMMDVMRVDDHSFIGEKGGIVNPTKALESERSKELKASGFMDRFPNAKLVLSVNTDLPTEEDHNYRFYRDAFIRTVETHKRKIARYKVNHPNCKVIFFVFDESSAYMERTTDVKSHRAGQVVSGAVHWWFMDAAFLSVFRESDIDYLIWYAPYKLIEFAGAKRVELPRAVVYNVKEMNVNAVTYHADLMESVEV